MNALRPYNYTYPDDVALISNYPNNGIVYAHKTYYDYCTNCRKKKKNFGFQAGLGFSVSFNGSNGRFSYSTNAPGTSLIYPQDMRIRMYGAVKVNGSWHGSLLIHNMN